LWLLGIGVVCVGAGEWIAVAGAAAAAAAEELALGVVFASPGRVGEGVVGVVDYLELARAGGAFWGVLRDTVRVGFEGGSAAVLVLRAQSVAHRTTHFLYASRI
jgi:hypothetical protein